MNRNKELNYKQVRQAFLQTMKEQVRLTTASTKCDAETVWDVLGLASVKGSTIHGTCQGLEDAPTGPGVLYQLRAGWLEACTLPQLEEEANDLVTAQLPDGLIGKAHEVVFDLTEIPYHGQAQANDAEIRRSRAKQGTTHFHVYGSAYILRRHK